MAKGFVAELNDVLEDFYELVKDEFVAAENEVAEECVRQLKAVSWDTDTGKRYSATWTLKKAKGWGGFGNPVVVHNSKNYQLTHLLENGHAVVNAKGNTGKRAAAHKHIYPVYEWAQGELEREIRQRIERG